jgi:serine/threonine protein kinase
MHVRFRIKYQLGIQFVDDLLVLDPKKRPTASTALDHAFFWDDIKPCKPQE